MPSPPSRSLFSLYLPLALSFELMMLEGPSVQWAIGRLPDTQTNLAAWGLTMQLSLLIESPVIMLLATAIALVKNASAFRALKAFMLRLALYCTLVTGLIAFTPLFELICAHILGQPAPITEAAKLPLQLMLFWSAAIAWRRFYQGVLVRQGQTSRITAGTAVRLVAVVVPALILVGLGRLSGAATAAVAIMAGVLVEAACATAFGRAAVAQLPTAPGEEQPLTQKAISRFHTPLALTTVLTLAAQPLTSAAIARLPLASQNLAAWPVVFSALLVLRGWGFAVQEITVAQLRQGKGQEPPLARFAAKVGLLSSAAAILLATTPLAALYASALGVPLELQPLVQTGILWGSLLPLLAAISSYVRGVLVAHQRTMAVYWGMALGLFVQALLLVAGVLARQPAIPTAAVAFTLAGLAETAYLLAQARRASHPA